MQITSYARNFEDVILWRALKHVERGFYIDIGAQDPVIDSVSLAFYEQGWRGVHVEPVSCDAQKLREARPDEIVIQAAIGSRRGRIRFWKIPGTGLSTGDPAVAKLHKQQNRKYVSITVPCMRLSQLFERYRGKEMHWLKIDVEGMERSVIQSWQPSKARPWIVVVESTKPISTEPNFSNFEPLIVKLGYEFVYFDGVNRFYVSQEHSELKETFGPGPNFFDRATFAVSTPFCKKINAEVSELRNQLPALANDASTLAAKLAEKNAEIAKHAAREANLRQQLAAVYGSTSWRVGAPLRFVSHTARWLARGSRAWIMLKPDFRPRRTARRVVLLLGKRRGLVVVGKLMLALFPSLRKHTQTSTRLVDANERDLSIEPEGVRRIYRQLSSARKASLSRMSSRTRA